MDTAVTVALVAAGASLITAGVTFRSTAQAHRANARKVDLEEHRDGLDRLQKIIAQQDRHIERLQEQLAREQSDTTTLRAQVRSLQLQVDDLARSRSRLEEILGADRPSRKDPIE